MSLNLYNPQQEDINYLKKLLADGQITPEQLSGMQVNGSVGGESPNDAYYRQAFSQTPNPTSNALAEAVNPQSSPQSPNMLAQLTQPQAGANQWNMVPRGTGVVQTTNPDGSQNAPVNFGEGQNYGGNNQQIDMTRPIEIGGKKGYYSKDGKSAIVDGQQVLLGYDRAQSQANQDRQMKIDKFNSDFAHVGSQTDINNVKLKEMNTPAQSGPGGAGSEILSDPQTGIKYSVNVQTGNAYRSDESGAWVPVNINSIPNNAQKLGAGQGGSGREAVQTERVRLGLHQVGAGLSNIVELPVSASGGLFGGRTQGAGLLDATREQLANKVTPQEAQSYGVMNTGIARSLAAIEAAGLMPSGALTKSMDSVSLKETDTQLTKLQKLAEIRQIAEVGGQFVLDKPNVSNQQKDAVRKSMDDLKNAVPFTQKDLLKLGKLQESNPGTKLRDVIGAQPSADQTTPQSGKTELDSMPMAGSYKGKQLTTPDGTRYLSDGNRWVRQ